MEEIMYKISLKKKHLFLKNLKRKKNLSAWKGLRSDKQIKRDINDLSKVYFPKKWFNLILKCFRKSGGCNRKVFVKIWGSLQYDP